MKGGDPVAVPQNLVDGLNALDADAAAVGAANANKTAATAALAGAQSAETSAESAVAAANSTLSANLSSFVAAVNAAYGVTPVAPAVKP